MKIAVIDGQGGGIGKAIVEKLRTEFADKIEIIALGTNALATAAMLKAGADVGASGENAIVFTCSKVDIIAGAIGIIAANSMWGEFTPHMTQAISESPARKLLIPLNRCSIEIIGTTGEPLPRLIDSLADYVRKYL